MDLNNRTLDNWLADPPIDAFPKQRRIDYAAPYRMVEQFLNAQVHPHVVAMAALHDYPEGGYLTGHGPEHIQAVIARASDLVSGKSFQLTAEEVFFLLLAIQVHDVGMLFAGRVNHEFNARRIRNELENRAGIDAIHARLILEIAGAHGGSGDTIGKLSDEREGIRLQLLAAILRFADELSDDHTREARFLMDKGLMRPPSEVYHLYARSLREVLVRPDEKRVALRFEIAEPWISKKARKKNGAVYLLDEIYERTVKMHLERIYCMRFMRGEIEIDSIQVTIGVYDKEYATSLRPEIKYTLAERGYPSTPRGGIHKMCDTFGSGTTAPTGASLRQELRQRSRK